MPRERSLTDASGNRDVRNHYQPFGDLSEHNYDVAFAAEDRRETKGFIGERYDAGAGLQYLNARYYDPVTGLFLQPDWFEVTEPGVGTNRYSYSFNDPVNLMDPGGNAVESGWDIFNAAIDALSLSSNLAAGNYGGAALDGLGLAVDLAATAIPGAPGGAGAAIAIGRIAKGGTAVSRASGRVSDLAIKGKHAQTVSSAARGLQNNLKGLKAHDILGAVKETLGYEVKDRTGKTRDHIHEVMDSLRGLRNHANKLERVLKDDRLSKSQRKTIEGAIASAHKHADTVEKTLEIAKDAAAKAKEIVEKGKDILK